MFLGSLWWCENLQKLAFVYFFKKNHHFYLLIKGRLCKVKGPIQGYWVNAFHQTAILIHVRWEYMSVSFIVNPVCSISALKWHHSQPAKLDTCSVCIYLDLKKRNSIMAGSHFFLIYPHSQSQKYNSTWRLKIPTYSVLWKLKYMFALEWFVTFILYVHVRFFAKDIWIWNSSSIRFNLMY